MKRAALAALRLLIALGLLLPALSCTRQEERLYKKSAVLMYTRVTITVAEKSPEKAEAAMDAAFEEIKRLEDLLSFWTSDSEIAAINRNAGIGPVKVSPETLEIIRESLFISEKTAGAFDPTIGPVIRLWDFRNETVPEASTLRETVGQVDYREMKVDTAASTAFLARKGMSFDTGGIAKGYAADRAVEVLKSAGIKSGLVAVAGDIRAFGSRPGGEPWRIGIRDPRPQDEDGYLMATIELRDEAVSTSGDYERFFIKDGVRYHHLLDPRTGYPAEGCRSVTVIAPKAVYTDGFSTGVFVLGPQKGLRLLEEMGLEGIIVDSQGKTHATQGLKGRLNWTGGREDAVAGQ
ncbi:MAG: FAD:protein FMN transferase [Thermodesulfovibrionales bacterium]